MLTLCLDPIPLCPGTLSFKMISSHKNFDRKLSSAHHKVVEVQDSFWLFGSDSLIDAIKKLEINEEKTLFVVNNNSQLIGTLTDGDIRRGLLKGVSLQDCVSSVMNEAFISLQVEQNLDVALKHMAQKGVIHAPIIDLDGRIQNILIRRQPDEAEEKLIDVLILAGGEGKRLRPLTNDCPKPMLDVNGKPMLEHIIEHCKGSGFKSFYLSVNYLKEKIISYFGDGRSHGITISYLEETAPLGTAGPMSLLPRNTRFPLLVINGDVLTSLDYESLLDFHNQAGADITVCVNEQNITIPYGVVESEGSSFVGIKEKPIVSHKVSAGMYLLGQDALNFIKKDEYLDVPELLIRAKQGGLSICVFPLHERWIDVGLPQTFQRALDEWNMDI